MEHLSGPLDRLASPAGGSLNSQSDFHRRFRSQSSERPAASQRNQSDTRLRSRSLEGLAAPTGESQNHESNFFHPRFRSQSSERPVSPPAVESRGNQPDISSRSSSELAPGASLEHAHLAMPQRSESESNILRLHMAHSLPELVKPVASFDHLGSFHSLPEMTSHSVELPSGNISDNYVVIETPPGRELPVEHQIDHQEDTPVDYSDLGIDTKQLFKVFGITDDPELQRVALGHFANIKGEIEALIYMGAELRPNEGIKRIDAIDKQLQEMLEQLKGEQEITAMRRYYNEFVRHANTWYGQAIVGSLIGAANDIYPSLLNKGWVWSTFILGSIAAGSGGVAVRKLGFPWNVLTQTGAGQGIIIGGDKLQRYITAKYHLS